MEWIVCESSIDVGRLAATRMASVADKGGPKTVPGLGAGSWPLAASAGRGRRDEPYLGANGQIGLNKPICLPPSRTGLENLTQIGCDTGRLPAILDDVPMQGLTQRPGIIMGAGKVVLIAPSIHTASAIFGVLAVPVAARCQGSVPPLHAHALAILCRAEAAGPEENEFEEETCRHQQDRQRFQEHTRWR